MPASRLRRLDWQSPRAVRCRTPWSSRIANGWTGYLGTDEDRRRGGYETALWNRCFPEDVEIRPLPYALGAADAMISGSLALVDQIDRVQTTSGTA